jgi:hypothetical protein
MQWLLWIIAGIAGGIATYFVVRLALSQVLGWFELNKTDSSKYGELIKEYLASGKYRIVAGIFDKRGIQTATNVWETAELEDDLAQYFGNRNRVRVEL